ncbi:MAG: hypothetical protein IH624_14735 [Phycisphaerae bacterium]|nr:hypothetical protein [Phycisphaerae bacterium]
MYRKMTIPLIFTTMLWVQFACAGAQDNEACWKQDRFLITFWCPPPATDEALARVAAEHYNLTWVGEEGLDAAQRHGLRAMLTSGLLDPAALDDAGRRAQLDALIERVKGHAALEAYYIVDEPGAQAFAGLGRLVAYLRERDPKRLAYINLFPTYANEQQLGVTAAAAVRGREACPTHLAGVGPDNAVVLAYREHLLQFVDIVKPDLISYDHYHFFREGDGPQYFLNMALIREAAMMSGKPWLNIIQASTLEKVWRLPNAAEMRWLVFTTMASGGRGISYFTYWGPEAYGGLYQDGKAAPLAAVVAGINAEIENFGPALVKLDSLGVYHTEPLPLGTEGVPADAPVQIVSEGEFVLGLFGRDERVSAFMVVNRSYSKTAEAVLKLKLGDGTLEELDRASGKWIKASAAGPDENVKVVLPPGDGRLFRKKR